MIQARDFLTHPIQFASPNAPAAPTVSVILPTYSRRHNGLLERSIRSVLAQRFSDFELLVMDDGSSDGSEGLIEEFRQIDPRVIHVRHTLNCGLPGLRVNEGIEMARGRFLAFQFDDDVWRENALHDLVEAASRQNEPSVIVGRAQVTSRLGKGTLPPKPVEIVSLMEMNCIANNSVLLPRTLIERFGMYDPHIGMRRLTDWDLWLRLIRHVPFITLDSIVSEVFESNDGAIGVTVPWDLELFRYLHSIARDALLLPSTWRDYQVDALRIGTVEIQGEFRRRLYEEQIVPFYLRHRQRLHEPGGFSATLPDPQPKTVMYAKSTYDVSNEVTLAHYDAPALRRGSFKSYYQTLSEVSPNWCLEADMALVMRSVDQPALAMVDQAQQNGRPLGLYLDDDLFTFPEYGPAFEYLAPGTPLYNNLVDITTGVDGVLCTTAAIAASVHPHNRRIIPHSNTIPSEMLPAGPHPRGTPLRIVYAGSGYRIDEFRDLWPAFERVALECGNALTFEFWGLDISKLPPLAAPVIQRPFTFSYQHYLHSLQEAAPDIMLSPLLDHPTPRLGKSLIKYFETAAAGALGIFSDVAQYSALPGGLTCLKAANDSNSWYMALTSAIRMPPDEFDRIRRDCIQHVGEEYSAEAQINQHEAALRALEFHATTRELRGEDGRPKVMYVLHSAHSGGAEIQLQRRLRLAAGYGIQPVVVIPGVLEDTESGRSLRSLLSSEGIPLEAVEYTCFTEPRSPAEFYSDLERGQIRTLLERVRPALVHTVTFIPSFGQVCREMGIAHVATLYAVEDEFAWQEGRPGFRHCSLVQSDCLRYARRWGELLDVPHIVARDMAPESLFRLGWDRHHASSTASDAHPLRLVVTGTFQERKQQLETIRAAGLLREAGFDFSLEFFGYTHFFPDYVNACRAAITECGLEGRVSIEDFTDDLGQVLGEADGLLSLSTYESFPGSIKDALAAGVAVVATPAGGVRELIIDDVTGVLCTGFSVEALADGIRRMLQLEPEARRALIENGRRVAREELHPSRAANDLFTMYNRAIMSEKSVNGAAVTSQPIPSTPSRSAIQRSGPASDGRRARMQAPLGAPGGLFPIGAGVVYRLRPAEVNWCGLDLLVEPHGHPVAGRIIVTVRSQSGNLLRQSSCELATILQASWVEIRFPPIYNSRNDPFRIETSYQPAHPGTVLSLYQNQPPQRLIRIRNRLLRLLGMRLHGDQLHCRMWYQ